MRTVGFILAGAALWTWPAVAGDLTSEPPSPSAELLAPRPRSPSLPSLHPPVVLRDAQGVSVLESGAEASPAKTCDGCHDARWIQAHDYHASMSADEFRRAPALVAAGNCFLCHVATADNQARRQAIASGRMEEAPTATLLGTGLVAPADGGWQWRKERFASDGTVSAVALGLGRPTDRACGFCHGLVYDEPAPLLFAHAAGQRMTDLEGAIFSGQRISDSAMNLAGKDGLVRPWDVHKERMVSCASCHFPPNHPAYSYVDRGIEHLQFDARRLAITEYLRRPDHRLARGPSGSGSAHRDATLRRCESCHDAPKVHRWLPRKERHFAALLCEVCHVPVGLAPAREVTDWTMLTSSREPRVTYRGMGKDGLVEGFRPVLLPRAADGGGKLAPNNLITTFQWVEMQGGKPRPVARALLERAFFTGDGYRPELVAALDGNRDGKLQASELVLDSAAKVKVARDLLLAAGARAPEIAAEVTAHELHHGVSPGRFATRDCADCHAAKSRIDAPLVVASALPFGVTPGVDAAAGTLARDAGGGLVFTPKAAGLHVFGHTRNPFLDGLGIVLLAGVIVGSGAHALLRVRAARRRDKERR
jgi:hypothetical protein